MKTKWTIENIDDLTGKAAVVTGANSGIGYEMALALASKKAKVILACRNREKGEGALEQIKQKYPDAEIRLLPLDLSDLSLVRGFVKEFRQHYDRLDILINNAGIMAPPYGKTAEGFESQFGTNHLGHFTLTGLLLDLLIKTPRARVVTVSSLAHLFVKMDFDNLNAEKKYDPQVAYGYSKLANILFTYELQRRFKKAGVDTIASAVHPGWTATNLQDHWPVVRFLNKFLAQKPAMGALPALYAATSPEAEGGNYYGPGGWLELHGYPVKSTSGKASYNTGDAERLWELSEELTGVTYTFS
ncbi:MAG: SDR family oxidoreductase [Spirochaetales bacterium]|nr:SDR family oxidoreductase [Spirochaetales bacterium]